MSFDTNEKTKTNKEKILSSLLEGPKTTEELLFELGYRKDQTRVIGSTLTALKDQDKLIDFENIPSTKIKNTTRKQYSIIKSLENFDNMLKKYPDLLQKMCKSETVLDVFIIRITIPWIDEASGESGVIPKFLEGDEKEYLKGKMRLSPEFFLYVINKINGNSQDHTGEFAEFIEQIENNSLKEKEEQNVKIWKKYGKDYKIAGTFSLETVFELCVFMDILKGQSSEEAKKYVIKMKNEKKRYYCQNQI
jgi:hypothetical protein